MLPGFGWDNLRNVDQGQVVNFNYSQCRTTDDMRFLLPDSVSTVPVKTSSVAIFAELFTHWSVRFINNYCDYSICRNSLLIEV